ncbi:MAG: GTP-binding protein [Candidatus Levybacteria bacterium]|nr:GTP-binding protein [Candidatus Levybacteria bacterium]
MEKTNVQTKIYPPVVSVLGHVDHGKTTLLDTIRKSNVATGEAGGITQAIGASKIAIKHEGKERFITFIDTPGHEAFSNMRSHGVSASDIVLLVVAADDGIKPQTKESIEKIIASKLPFIVVITKTDAPGANIAKVKQELAKEGVLLEGMGGDVPFIGVSAKTGDKITDLLDLIVIVYDLSDINKDQNAEFTGVVIEAKLDKRRGILASLIVNNGKISVGEKIYTVEKEVGKTKALVDTTGSQVKVALPGDAVEVMGFTEVLPAGSVVNIKGFSALQQPKEVISHSTVDLMKILQTKQNEKLPVIIKTQTSGEFEAILQSLPADVEVVYEGRGEISVSDILMARDFGAIVVGFNVDIEKQAKILAESIKTFYRTYNIIYNLLDELIDAVTLIHERAQRKIFGKAQILALFEGNEGRILGVRIIEGRLAVGDKMIITRGEAETPESSIISLKQGKKDVKELGKGNECGIMIDPQVDFTIGDMIISYS